jgi:hypothetical protein
VIMKSARQAVVAGSTLLAGTGLILAAPGPAAQARPAGAVAPAAGQRHIVQSVTAAMATTNNKVDALAYARGVVYAGGLFTKMAYHGTHYTRHYLGAVDRAKGKPTSFRPNVNGQVMSMAVSPDKKVLYIGGSFTKVGTATRVRVAAFWLSTGRLIRDFHPDVNSSVHAIAVTTTGVYLGGTFSKVNGQARTFAAEVTTHGRVKTLWQPRLDRWVRALLVSPDKTRILLGGGFTTVNGVPMNALASVNSTTAVNEPFVNGLIPTYTDGRFSEVTSLASNGTDVYAGAEGTGGGAFDGTLAFRPDSGTLVWRNTCLGATQAVLYLNGVLYKASHAHDCSSAGGFPQIMPHWQAHHLLAESARTGRLLTWGTSADSLPAPRPNTNGGLANALGPYAFTTDGRQVFVGGEFTIVNGKPQEGLARFSY